MENVNCVSAQCYSDEKLSLNNCKSKQLHELSIVVVTNCPATNLQARNCLTNNCPNQKNSKTSNCTNTSSVTRPDFTFMANNAWIADLDSEKIDILICHLLVALLLLLL